MNILAIDDNCDNLITLEALVKEAFPFAKITCESVPEKAFDSALHNVPDIVLMDLLMPGTDGFTLCRRFKMNKTLQDSPVIFVTALKGDKDSRIKALEAGGEAFLLKPIDESELTAQIRAMMKIRLANLDKKDQKKRLETSLLLRTEELRKELEEKKRIEEALKSSEEGFKAILNATGDAAFMMDRNGNVIALNSELARRMGKTPEELIGRCLYDFMSSENAEFRKNMMDKVFETGEPVIFEDGRNGVIIESRVFPLKDEDGHVYKVVVFGRDITEHRKAENALAESEKRVRSKLDAILAPEGDIGTLELSDLLDIKSLQKIFDLFHSLSGIGVAIIDLDGKILLATGWQEICLKFHRRNPETLKNCIESDTVLSKAVPEGEYSLYKCKNGIWDAVTPIFVGGRHLGNLFLGQFFFDGEEPNLDFFRGQALKYGFNESEYLESLKKLPRFKRKTIANVMRFYSRLANLVSALGYSNVKLARSMEDLSRRQTEKESLSEQLVQSQKMESVGRLAGGIAHDFNNMLSVILGYTDITLRSLDKETVIYSQLSEIRKAAERSADLTRQLLAFAKKQTIQPKIVGLNSSVSEMLKILKRLIGEHIELSWSPGKDLWTVFMDPGQIDQILANLAVNSRDAIGNRGEIRISTSNVSLSRPIKPNPDFRKGDYVLLRFSDNGSGISEAHLEKIFEPFFTTKKVGEGTGLGLSTVYGAVRQNNGFIDVFSKPGEGTQFDIYLPKHESADPSPEDEPGSELKSSSGCSEAILMVEDETSILDLGKTMLESLGYKVACFSSPLDAISAVKTLGCEIDLLLTDVIMPDMNGKNLAKILSGIFPKMRHLYMSGYTSDVISKTGMLEDGLNFIQKPFSLDKLALAVRRALDSDPP